jgi:hypothetical protein
MQKKGSAKGESKSNEPARHASGIGASSDTSRKAPVAAAKPAAPRVCPAPVPTPAPKPERVEKSAKRTKVVVKFDAGFPNQLFIRGSGANLSWERGQPLRNIQADEWIWEAETTSSRCEFKVLLNDQRYEEGENHKLDPGASISYTPRFS